MSRRLVWAVLVAAGMLLLGAPRVVATETVTLGPTFAPTYAQTLPVRSSTPILLSIYVDYRWQVAEAAAAWNAALGCTVFITEPDGLPHVRYLVVEDDTIDTGGLAVYPWTPGDKWIKLRPDYLEVPGVAAHETGHTLGVQHIGGGVMSGDYDADRSHLHVREITEARSLQIGRCGEVDPHWTATPVPVS